MKLQVYRINASSYQGSQFLSREKRILEEIKGIKYIQSIKEIDSDLPFVLLTNTKSTPKTIAPNILEKTKLLIHPNSGFENIPPDFIRAVNFPIITGGPIRSNAVCEYILGCIFKKFVQIPNHMHWSDSRNWERKLLRDQKILIIGHGHIGKILHQSLSPLCHKVKVYDPFISNQETNQSTTDEIITQWDESIFDNVSILILAASLTSSSQKIINKNILKRLSQENLIINTARGQIINEDDLIQYLQKAPKSFCFLDVFEKEPFSPGYLNNLPNLNKTSHIAGVYDRLNHDIISFEYLVIKDFIEYYLNDNLQGFSNEYHECLLTEKASYSPL